MRRSVASGRRFSKTSSTSSKSFARSLHKPRASLRYDTISKPALMAWNKNALCIASRTGLLPRKENDILLTPPLQRAPGQTCLISRTASINQPRSCLCSSMPVATVKIFGSKMISEDPYRHLRKNLVSALTYPNFILFGCCLALFIKRHYDDRGTVAHCERCVFLKDLFAFF